MRLAQEFHAHQVSFLDCARVDKKKSRETPQQTPGFIQPHSLAIAPARYPLLCAHIQLCPGVGGEAPGHGPHRQDGPGEQLPVGGLLGPLFWGKRQTNKQKTNMVFLLRVAALFRLQVASKRRFFIFPCGFKRESITKTQWLSLQRSWKSCGPFAACIDDISWCILLGCLDFNFLPTNGLSIKPLVKLFAGEHQATEFLLDDKVPFFPLGKKAPDRPLPRLISCGFL